MTDEPLYKDERDFVRFSPSDWRAPLYGTASFKDYARVLHSASWRRLQGKMQLFPIGENDILRTRLTHSLEVAEIAVRIANWLNGPEGPEYLRQGPGYAIDRDVVATAALSHDLGHPPFGHSGEHALNAAMEAGVFEGNAQTLRIVTNLESRHDTVSIRRIGDIASSSIERSARPRGLDLTYRTLAAIIKYDRNADAEMQNALANARREQEYAIIRKTLYKGYYAEEEPVVSDIKRCLLSADFKKPLYTIECQIMDLADDIAYSTYDLEDAMISGLVTPFDVIACQDVYLELIKKQLNAKLKSLGYDGRVDEKDVLTILMQVFSNILSYANVSDYAENTILQRIAFVARSYRENLMHAANQPIRRRFMETLIEGAVRSITVQIDYENPMLSKIHMDIAKFLEIECLKAFTFHTVTSSQSHQIYAHRSAKIVKTLWEELSQDAKGTLLPDDLRQLFDKVNGRQANCIVRDLIATLTDKEATDLYNRLTA